MNSIPVGVSTWIFGNHSLRDISKVCSEFGFACIELFVDISTANSNEILRDCAPLVVASMTPENVDIGHIDAKIRRASVEYYKRLADFAKAVGAPAITCHEFVGRTQAQDNVNNEWSRLVESCRQIVEAVEQIGISVLFEPLNAQLVSSATSLGTVLKLVQTIGSESFRVVLDTFHLLQQSQDPFPEIIEASDHVAAIQLADHRRYGLGEKSMDRRIGPWLRTFVEKGFRGPWILECTRELTGPSLTSVPANISRLSEDLGRSVSWLRSQGLLEVLGAGDPSSGQ